MKYVDLISVKHDEDGTQKYIYRTSYTGSISHLEIGVILNRKDRICLCLPTFTNCNLGCKMCHLTHITRKVDTHSISYHILLDAINSTLTELCKLYGEDYTTGKTMLLSFMGVGEPLNNIDVILDVAQLITSSKQNYITPESLFSDLWSRTKISIATTMPDGKMSLLLSRLRHTNVPIKIHFSLISMDRSTREYYIPSYKRSCVSPKAMLKSLVDYNNTLLQKSSYTTYDNVVHRIVGYELYDLSKKFPFAEIHFTPMEKNTSDEEIQNLVDILSETGLPIKIISYNEVKGVNGSKTPEEQLFEKLTKLLPNNIVEYYVPPGRSIGASCGEFECELYQKPKPIKSVDMDIPFDKNGNMLYENSYQTDKFIKNHTFKATLKLHSWNATKSSANIEWVDTVTGILYYSFLSDSFSMFKIADHGIVSGEFTFCKKNDKYGIKMK